MWKNAPAITHSRLWGANTLCNNTNHTIFFQRKEGKAGNSQQTDREDNTWVVDICIWINHAFVTFLGSSGFYRIREGGGFGETEGAHERVTFLWRVQIYREGVSDYTAQSRVTLHTNRLLCDVSLALQQLSL